MRLIINYKHTLLGPSKSHTQEATNPKFKPEVFSPENSPTNVINH